MIPKSSQNDPNVIPKWPQSHPKVTPKSSQSDPKMIPKWSQSGDNVTPTWSQNDPQMTPKWPQSDPKVTPKWPQSEPMFLKNHGFPVFVCVREALFLKSLDFRIFNQLKKLKNYLILEVSGVKTITIRSSVKNPIQRTTFYLQRRSGARVTDCFVFADWCFSCINYVVPE